MSEYIHKLIEEYSKEAIKHREMLHRHPELSFEEHETAAFIRGKLAEYGIETLPGISGCSTVGYIDGAEDGPVIAFRADIDALPVCEAVDLPFKSEVDGVMHACGHDAHAATLLAFARLLSEHRDMIRGRVKFIFQQGEELLPGGAKLLCEEGAVSDCDYVFAYHALSNVPIGSAWLVEGSASQAAGVYHAVIRGKGGHGGMPHLSNNPIICAANIANAVVQIPGTVIDPMETSVATVAYLMSGVESAKNIIPDQAVIGGNLRSFDNDVQTQLYERLEYIVRGYCDLYGCECDLEVTRGYPSIMNDGKATEIMAAALSESSVTRIEQQFLASEDYAFYTIERPSCMVLIGFYDEQSGKTPMPHHNPAFEIDAERGIPIALEVLTNCYLKAIET